MPEAATPRRSSPPPAEDPPQAGRRPEGHTESPYEFSDVHKESFRALAMSMTFLGVFTMLIGGLSAVFALGALYEGFTPNGVVIGASAVVQMLMASWLLSASRSLSAMMRTKGRDVQYAMEAIAQLRRYFGMTIVILMIAMLGAIVLVVWCVAGSGKCFGLLG